MNFETSRGWKRVFRLIGGVVNVHLLILHCEDANKDNDASDPDLIHLPKRATFQWKTALIPTAHELQTLPIPAAAISDCSTALQPHSLAPHWLMKMLQR